MLVTGLLLATVTLLPVFAAPASVPSVSFKLRSSTSDTGDVLFAANTIMACSARPHECPNAEMGQGGQGNLNNDMYSMVYVNVDAATPSLFNSSSADLAPGRIPGGGQSVSFAGLYWGGRSANPSRSHVQFRVPGAGYTRVSGDLTGPVAPGTPRTNDKTGGPESYQMFADVTALVRGAGAGTYTVGNIQTDQGL